MYSFYPVLHVAARFFLNIVKMWVSPLVHDAIHISIVINTAMDSSMFNIYIMVIKSAMN